MMGTLGILKALRGYVLRSSHPIYRAESVYAPPVSLNQTLKRYAHLKNVLFIALIALALLSCLETLPGNWNWFFWLFCFSGLGLPFLGIVSILYLLPLAVAVSASRTIAREREAQTWDTLLTTPMEWSDIILAKLAASMNRYEALLQAVPWVNLLMGSLTFLMVSSHIAHTDNPGNLSLETLQWGVAFMATIAFVIERHQDYVLANLIGASTALAANNPQTASINALGGMIGFMLLRGLLIAGLVFFAIQPRSMPELVILIMSGPSSTIAVGLPLLLAALSLVILPIAHEIVIRRMFRHLVAHLGEGIQSSVTV